MREPYDPPFRLIQFFRWFCDPALQEDIEGDLREIYKRLRVNRGERKAKWAFLLMVLSLLRPNLIRIFSNYHFPHTIAMYENYLKVAWRNMRRQKLYSLVNIGGLSIGLTCFILIFLYVQHEISYDRFHSQSNRIYRVYQQQKENVYLGSNYFAVTPAGLSDALDTEIHGVESATTLQEKTALLVHQENSFWEKGLTTDETFLEIFDFKLLQGDPLTALKQPRSIVLTESLAAKIFGALDPIGKSLMFDNNNPYQVTGIIADPPTHSSLKFSFISCIQSHDPYLYDIQRPKWENNGFHTFMLLQEEVDPQAIEAQLPQLIKKYAPNPDGNYYEFDQTYFLQPLSQIHLENHFNFDIGLKGNPRYVNLFSWIAIIVLLLACVNYTNLAIARSIKRTREVGLRKTIGAMRAQLMGQFLGESVLMTSLSLILAVGLTYLLLPTFSKMLERPINLDFIQNGYLLPGLLLLIILVGFISGSYPAIMMSSLSPITVLRNKINTHFSGSSLQKWLIVGQFAASITLAIGSLVIYQQFEYIRQKEMGYNTSHILSLRIREYSLGAQLDLLKAEWLRDTQVQGVTRSNALPTNVDSSTIINDDDERDKTDDMRIYEIRADYDYLDLFGLKLVAGRNFSPQITTDQEQAYIINETAAQALGYTPEEAIGKQFTHMGTETIIGVVKDFHMHSLHMAIEPLMIHLEDHFLMSIKVHPENLSRTIASLKDTYQQYTPYPFEYEFLDEKFDQLYKEDMQLGEMFRLFTLISIVIAALGLFGLAAFSAERRTKEMGIRKVLGASATQLVSLLAKDFLTMVLMGFIIAIPIGWYTMSLWLKDYAYRIEIEWWIFALAGFAALFLAILAVSFQSLKAARTNPVESIRVE